MPDAGATSMLGGWALRCRQEKCDKYTPSVSDKLLGNRTTPAPLFASCYDYTVHRNLLKVGDSDSIQGFYNVGFIFVQMVAMAVLLYHIIVNARRARRGDYEASKRLILPIYKKIVYIMCCCQFFSSIFVLYRLIAKAAEVTPLLQWSKSFAVGLSWGLLHWVTDGVAVFLCQPSAGRDSGILAAKLGGASAFFSLVMGTAKHHYTEFDMPEGACGDTLWCCVVPFLYQFTLLVAYGNVYWRKPEPTGWGQAGGGGGGSRSSQPVGLDLLCRRVYRRPAANAYVRFWFWFRVLTIFASLLLANPFDSAWLINLGFCVDFGAEVFIFTLGKAYVVYTALREDSMYWQGAVLPSDRTTVNNAESMQTELMNGARLTLSSPLQGKVDIEASDAVSINHELSDVPSDMVINFGYLWLDKSKTGLLGSGGSARVYRAELKGEHVAAKVLYCPSIDRNTVKNFFKEAARLRQCRHPNIVELKGVCVLPPTICIVLELCRGDLRHHVLELRQAWFPSSPAGDGRVHAVFFPAAEQPADLATQRRVLSLLGILRDMVAGVSRIHEFGLIHLDIKSQNFLVSAPVDVAAFTTGTVTVKLADLENSIVKEEFFDSEDTDVVRAWMQMTVSPMIRLA
jgi:uncharacterized membrane protein (DUF485 family)